MKERVADCSKCDVRDRCGVLRMLEAGGVEPKATAVKTKSNESFSREDALKLAGPITVRKGLISLATYPSGEVKPLHSYIAGPGATLTISSVLKDAPAPDYIISLTPAELCVADREAVERACSNSHVAMREMLALALNLTGLQARLNWIRSGSSVRQRTERFLAEVCLWNELRKGSSSSVIISHAAIASILTVERCSVSTTLAQLGRDGYVSAAEGKRKLVVIDDSFLDSPEYANNPFLNGERLPAITGDNIDL